MVTQVSQTWPEKLVEMEGQMCVQEQARNKQGSPP